MGIDLSDSDLADIALTVNLDDELAQQNQKDVYMAIATTLIPFLLLRPTSINEQGFSVSYDKDSLLRYYAWLCDWLGIDDSLNEKVVLTDISDLW